MNQGLKKGMSLLLAGSIFATALAGCTNGTSSSSSAASSVASAASTVNSDKPYDGVTLKYAVSDTATQGGETVELVELVKEKTGINLEFTIVPTTAAGEVDKLLVMLQGGQEIDVIYGSTPKLETYYNAGVLEPIDELAKSDNYDMEKMYGTSLPVMSDGETYGLPAFNDIWLTVYNKQIFDNASVEYPALEGFTWEKYIETAKKLTDTSKDIWGSFMLDYDNYNYMLATQKGAEPYKADGTANFDDPLYKEAMKFFYSLGNDEKIQPSSTVYASGQYPWNAFVASGNMGMWVIGGWALSMLPNQEKYPRDWKAGIAPMPYPEGSDPSTLAVAGCYGIPTTSKNADAAFEAIKCIAENQYTLGYGRVPARTDLTDAEITSYIEEKLVPTYEFDGITTEDIKACWFDSKRTNYSEKIVGVADTQISQIWIEEGQLYGQGSSTLDKAMENIQKRSNEAIQEADNG